GSRHRPATIAPPPAFRTLTPRPIVAGAQEVAQNPRARSAKLRAAERTDAPAANAEVERGHLPSLDQVLGMRR
ncbi:MAG TPA: 16S rRNA (cytosine(1402)-N(4))-methyltransferase, partial [Xanthobacteraceae bacterium]